MYANITRAEAQARSALISTHHYHVTVDLTGRFPDGSPLPEPESTFGASSSITFTSGAGQTHVDVIAERLLGARLDGEPIPTDGFDGTRLPITLTEGDHRLEVTAIHRYSRSGEGLHRFVDPADGKIYLYTQFETADARRMYANFEQPDLKATFDFVIRAPQGWTVISNTVADSPADIGDGFAQWTFATTAPISTYITALVAGEYHRVTREHITAAGTRVPMSLVARQSLADHLDADRIWGTTTAGFDVFEKHFGQQYPFGSYDQAFVPEYNMGAMENAGCVTFRDEYLFRSRVTEAAYESRDNTILHELAHMWFGDLVTMKWWDDLWLNESFAEWASHFAQSQIMDDPDHAWAIFGSARKTWAYRVDQLPTTHPIAADMVDLAAVELNFDGITYAKGASSLRQLVEYVGQDSFLAGLRDYFAEHKWGNTELGDLLAALEKVSGRDLGSWSAAWLEQPGVNTLRAEFAVDDQGDFTEFAVRQTAPELWPTLRPHRIGIGLYRLTDRKLTRTQLIDTDVDGERTEVPELVGLSQPDLVLLNDGDRTYAKVRLDDRSLQTVIEHLPELDSELARVVVMAAAWDMCRDAELSVAGYVDLVVGSVGSESDLTAVQRTLGQALLAVRRYATDPAPGNALVAGLVGLLKDAAPGSDHQLVFARSLASAVSNAAGIDLLQGWLAGEEVPQGLTIDQDFRWHLITQLSRLGGADLAVIENEAETDNTITGSERAAAARAAGNTAEAKEWAWQTATADPSVPNETHRQICTAFNQPGQTELLAPYLGRYLDVAKEISEGGSWNDRGSQAAQNVLEYLFPAAAADDAFLGRAEAWLAETSPSDTVRRVFTEQLDDVARTQRCREFNSTSTAG
ncbi:aminopeptidase N [Naumannella halotolerans]|uniref:aminopeptidase N n=1 Tax=Naumannella halotolerans TaxID=993414 RepID=UPI00370D07AE